MQERRGRPLQSWSPRQPRIAKRWRSHEPIFIWDLDRGILGWNRGSEDLYGYTREEAVGKQKETLLATVVPGSSFEELRAKLLKDGTWNGELRHRTKSGREITVESRIVLEVIDGRRLALASAHSLLVDSDWKGADRGELARHQLAAYTPKNPGRLQIEGEAVSLPADLATPFGLVLHELATNAAKYGSLSIGEGWVRLGWNISPRNNGSMLRIIWQELNGPPTTAPNGRGFGSILISRGIPNATVTREFKPEGLLCTIDLPLTDPEHAPEQ